MIDFIPPWSFFEKVLAIIPAAVSAWIARAALNWNQERERHRFRVCCQCLREEVDSHKNWIECALHHDIPLSREIVLSQPITRDFERLKYDDTFRFMPADDFSSLFAYYQGIEVQHLLIQKTPDHSMSKIVKESGIELLLEHRERLLKILDHHIKNGGK